MNAEKKFEDMLVTPKLILRWIREGDVYVNRLGEDEMESCKLQVEAALAQPEQPMSPEHLPQYIATNNLKPTIKGGGGAGGAQLEQEPVAWIKDGILGRCDLPKGFTGCLYTSPPKREFVEMTNEERFQAFVDAGLDLAYMDHDVNMKISKVIESRLKEKNT